MCRHYFDLRPTRICGCRWYRRIPSTDLEPAGQLALGVWIYPRGDYDMSRDRDVRATGLWPLRMNNSVTHLITPWSRTSHGRKRGARPLGLGESPLKVAANRTKCNIVGAKIRRTCWVSIDFENRRGIGWMPIQSTHRRNLIGIEGAYGCNPLIPFLRKHFTRTSHPQHPRHHPFPLTLTRRHLFVNSKIRAMRTPDFLQKVLRPAHQVDSRDRWQARYPISDKMRRHLDRSQIKSLFCTAPNRPVLDRCGHLKPFSY